MTLQNNANLLPVIQKVGCYFLSLVRMVELEAKYNFEVSQINDAWRESSSEGFIDKGNLILKPDKILTKLAWQTTSTKLRIFQIGQKIQNASTYWSWVASMHKVPDYLIEMRITKGAIGTHFVLRDRNNQLIYDSYSFKSYKITDGKRFLLFRVYQR